MPATSAPSRYEQDAEKYGPNDISIVRFQAEIWKSFLSFSPTGDIGYKINKKFTNFVT